ncbi:uncharacterized protein [Rutidosis leptorrhynchoides]|uniref:uncharacterized protein n=1 Tax=Rutidosis leptorrhynchoides TaxID=125765 RepID=UPI003A99B1F9
MDHLASKEEGVSFDLESGNGVVHSNEDGCPGPDSVKKLAKPMFSESCDGPTIVENSSVKLDSLNVNEGSLENKVKSKNSSSAKKPPRPPRPHGGFSLSAYDQKLIKELTQLAMIKRARIERMKALKQKKALKGSTSSSSSSSHGNFFAMVFTIIFFVVILLQGRNTGVSFHGSRHMAPTDGNGLQNIHIHTYNQLNQSSNSSISPNSKS